MHRSRREPGGKGRTPHKGRDVFNERPPPRRSCWPLRTLPRLPLPLPRYCGTSPVTVSLLHCHRVTATASLRHCHCIIHCHCVLVSLPRTSIFLAACALALALSFCGVATVQILHTTLGDIHFKLYPEECPRRWRTSPLTAGMDTCNDGIIFHRIIKVLYLDLQRRKGIVSHRDIELLHKAMLEWLSPMALLSDRVLMACGHVVLCSDRSGRSVLFLPSPPPTFRASCVKQGTPGVTEQGGSQYGEGVREDEFHKR